MNIAIRLFLGYFLVVGLAAWFVLNIFAREVEPGVRQAAEDTLVDTAHLLAELAVEDLAAGRIASGGFARAVADAIRRDPRAKIWDVAKESVDLRVYVTDARGIVVFDSAGRGLGADYSQWRDVAAVLRGEYGARSTRGDPTDPRSSVMYVAAPVLRETRLIGVLSVAKPTAALSPYADRARQRVHRSGVILLAASALVGVLMTLWLVWSLNRLRNYANAVAEGKKAVAPTLGGRQLSELARALTVMRDRLDGKQYVEHYVQGLAHEMKSPLSAVRGAAELLLEEPSSDDRRRFTQNIGMQAERMQRIIERLLALARVEQLQAPEALRRIASGDLIEEVVAGREAQLRAKALTVVRVGDAQAPLVGDPFLLAQAVANLLDNAIDFSPAQSAIEIAACRVAGSVRIAVRDRGPGAPDYALARLFERFYSLPRPDTGLKSTGLGLAFVREVAKVHGGDAGFANRPDGGGEAWIAVPAAPA